MPPVHPTLTNQRGAPVFETQVFDALDLNGLEAKQLVLLIADHLGLEVYRTNATKHGSTEVTLRPKAVEHASS